MSIYGVVIASITLTPIGFFLEEYPNVQYAMLGIMIMIITTLILGLVFVSKVTVFALHSYVCYIIRTIDVQGVS